MPLYAKTAQRKLLRLQKWTLSLGLSHVCILVPLLGSREAYLPLLPPMSHEKMFRQLLYLFPGASSSATVFLSVCLYAFSNGKDRLLSLTKPQHGDLKNNTVYFSFTDVFWIEQSKLVASCTLHSHSGTHVLSDALIHLHLWYCWMCTNLHPLWFSQIERRKRG